MITQNKSRSLLVCCMLLSFSAISQESFQLNDLGYFEKTGANVFVFNNDYNDYFGDSKISGIEFIHHGVRTVTNGDVRINRTPEQWDPIPSIVSKSVDNDNHQIVVNLRYEDFDFDYQLHVTPDGQGNINISVRSKQPIPEELVGRAAMHMEFLPSVYGGTSYHADDRSGMFSHYPADPMERHDGKTRPLPLASGRHFSLAPANSAKALDISSGIPISLYDGRNKAQNGWYVLQSLLPEGKTGTLVTWKVKFNTIQDWVRKPVIAHSQVGYHPGQQKKATIELDDRDQRSFKLELVHVRDMNNTESTELELKEWGFYKRYRYLQADFSDITAEGVYYLQYGNTRTNPFLISKDVYNNIWHPTLDIYFPVQMDHMHINEAYRVWHGRSHLDDARQAPVDHVHFDLYAQGPETDSPYEPGEHIPGLNVGGWYDAGDYDIRTQTQYYVILNMVRTWETFKPERDQTTVDRDFQYVDAHHPDGLPDLIQQIYHGAVALLAQYKAIGHAIPGIVSPDLSQYTHLGDGMTKTDNLVYDPKSDSIGSNGKTSAVPDDRWAFTNRTTSLTYGSVAALAAASRVLADYYPKFAANCRGTAIKAWNEEQERDPSTFSFGNTTGGNMKDEEIKATAELLKTTQDEHYARHLAEIWGNVEERFEQNAIHLLSVYNVLPEGLKQKTRELTEILCKERLSLKKANPFEVPITEGGWAGNGTIINFGITNYWIHKQFPELLDPEWTLASLNYILGHHPDSDISFVSGIGSDTKKVAYGVNRADFTYIPGGVVPGVLILPPDFPENKEDWPFLWGENEYVISVGSAYLFLSMAANDLVK